MLRKITFKFGVSLQRRFIPLFTYGCTPLMHIYIYIDIYIHLYISLYFSIYIYKFDKWSFKFLL